MHGTLEKFIRDMALAYPIAFRGKIVEFGSYDINGSPRMHFNAAEYVGIDHRPGPCVDVVTLGHAYREKPDGYFDTAISTSMFEHDPYWMHTLTRMVELVRPGGCLLVTAAGPDFHTHELETAPERIDPEGPGLPAGVHYGNIKASDLASLALALARWESVLIEDDNAIHDVRLFCYGKMEGAKKC